MQDGSPGRVFLQEDGRRKAAVVNQGAVNRKGCSMKIFTGKKKSILAMGVLGLSAALAGFDVSARSGIQSGQVVPLIIGGTEVPRGKYPFMASLQNEGEHFCGGSLLDARSILTAKHCVEDITNNETASHISVTVGQTLLSDEIGSQRRGISAVFVSTMEGSDLAVVVLDRAVIGIAPVALPTPGSDALYRPGQMATVIGWGNTDSEGFPYHPDRLREVDVPILSIEECIIAAPEFDFSTNFCGGVRGKGACHGDSGGPVIRVIGGRVYQIGTVFGGIRCAGQGAPGVYANLSDQRLWDSLTPIWAKF